MGAAVNSPAALHYFLTFEAASFSIGNAFSAPQWGLSVRCVKN
jgi:hypothetical protein